MKISKVSVRKLDTKNSLRAFVDIEFDECFVLKGIKVVDGKKGLFVAMPNEKGSDGKYYDTAFPITKKFREELNDAVFEEYDNADEPKKSRRRR